jgi:hypothetical protein
MLVFPMENWGLQGAQAIMGEIGFGSELQLKHHVKKNYRYAPGFYGSLKKDWLEHRPPLLPPSLPTHSTRPAYQV